MDTWPDAHEQRSVTFELNLADDFLLWSHPPADEDETEMRKNLEEKFRRFLDEHAESIQQDILTKFMGWMSLRQPTLGA